MSNVWRWVFGIAIGLMVVGWVLAGRSERQAYQVARDAVEQEVAQAESRILAVEQLAITAVNLALVRSDDLPADAVYASVVTQRIQAISDALQSAAEYRGQAAIDQLDQSIEDFDQALEAIDDASRQTDSPAVQSTLDRIYGTLEAAREQIIETILNGQ